MSANMSEYEDERVRQSLTVWRDPHTDHYHATLTVDCMAASRDDAVALFAECVRRELERLGYQVKHESEVS